MVDLLPAQPERRHLAFHIEYLRRAFESLSFMQRILGQVVWRPAFRDTCLSVLLDHRAVLRAVGVDPTGDRTESNCLNAMNYTKWIAHFERNRLYRAEPDWSAPVSVPQPALAPLVRSLEQFRLGDGGGPASLIAYDAERFRSQTDEMRALVDLWFAEEAEHSRLLGCAVDRFGGRHITSHWSFTAFCLCRRALGVRFELQVLLLTELVSTAYYRVLLRHSPDAPLAAMCGLILRDEAGHVAFHRDRLATAGRSPLGLLGALWQGQFWLCGHGAANMLWLNHGPCLKAIGGSRAEYVQEVRWELRRFIASLCGAVEPVIRSQHSLPQPRRQLVTTL